MGQSQGSSEARPCTGDDAVNEKNPDYMYPEGSHEEVEWWATEERPVASHIFNKDEMNDFAKANLEERSNTSKIQKPSERSSTRRMLCNYFWKIQLFFNEYPLPHGMHHPDRDYTEQQLVNLCCLVDTGRKFAIDTHYLQKSKNKFLLGLDSYELAGNRKLKSLASSRSKKKDPPRVKVFMQVYRLWMKNYLEWSNSDLYSYLLANADGMAVKRFRNQMAAEKEIDYQFWGVVDFDPLMVPLPKLHQKISTASHVFGETIQEQYHPYYKDAYDATVIPFYNANLTSSCNPPQFDYVPVAQVFSDKVPSSHKQITGLRADLKKVKKGTPVLGYWLGLQASKYVLWEYPLLANDRCG
jgi:hypothetical protein